MANPYNEFIAFERARDTVSTLEVSDRALTRYGSIEGLRNRFNPIRETTFSETAPILEETLPETVLELGLEGGATSAVATTGVSASSVAVGTGGAVAAAGLGYGIYKGVKEGFNYPGHRYLGPGNPTANQEPVDEDDRIAQKHDEAYDKAKTVDDVRVADNEAIHEFDDLYKKTASIHALIGKVGLQGKQFVEKYVGHLYPKLSKLYLFLDAA